MVGFRIYINRCKKYCLNFSIPSLGASIVAQPGNIEDYGPVERKRTTEYGLEIISNLPNRYEDKNVSFIKKGP